MTSLEEAAPAFVAMAHQIVWASVTTVDADGSPRARILHPLWEWDGTQLVGWIATGKTPVKARHLAANPQVAVSYWDRTHDTCAAVCRAEWCEDAGTREWLWQAFVDAPAPVGYDPSIIPGWDSPSSDGFLALKLTPSHLRVFPGSVLLTGNGAVLTWSA